MSDSFFTSRNQVDAQIERSPEIFCNELIEAATRRIVKLHGPLEASQRLQRIADVCAGAYVLPIDHWKNLGATKAEPAPEKKPEPKKARFDGLVRAVHKGAPWFLAGMIFNIFLQVL